MLPLPAPSVATRLRASWPCQKGSKNRIDRSLLPSGPGDTILRRAILRARHKERPCPARPSPVRAHRRCPSRRSRLRRARSDPSGSRHAHRRHASDLAGNLRAGDRPPRGRQGCRHPIGSGGPYGTTAGSPSRDRSRDASRDIGLIRLGALQRAEAAGRRPRPAPTSCAAVSMISVASSPTPRTKLMR